MATVLLDKKLIAEIKLIESVTGSDVLSAFVRKLEASLHAFPAEFAQHVNRGDITGAERAAHTLKGACRQLGAEALGELFAEIERSAKDGHYAEAKHTFEGGAQLIAQSLIALKQAAAGEDSVSHNTAPTDWWPKSACQSV